MNFQVSEIEMIREMFRHKKRYCKWKFKDTEGRQILLGYSSTGYSGMDM
jgi:hypothetical protein